MKCSPGEAAPRSRRAAPGEALKILGYEQTRQTGSHIRITTQRDGENHEVVPNHHPIKAGTLASILKRIASHHAMSVNELIDMLNL